MRQNGELTMSFAVRENSYTGSATAVNFQLQRFVAVLLTYLLRVYCFLEFDFIVAGFLQDA